MDLFFVFTGSEEIMKASIDAIDEKIIELMQENARISIKDIE